jgi:hypothetical protein
VCQSRELSLKIMPLSFPFRSQSLLDLRRVIDLVNGNAAFVVGDARRFMASTSWQYWLSISSHCHAKLCWVTLVIIMPSSLLYVCLHSGQMERGVNVIRFLKGSSLIEPSEGAERFGPGLF